MSPLALSLFAPLRLEDRPRLGEFLSGQDVYFCDYGFANLYLWAETFQTRWAILDERLWVYAARDDKMLWPVGRPLEPAELRRASDELKAAGRSGDFVFVDDEYVGGHPELAHDFKIQPDEDNADYIYLTQKLVQLQGSKLAKKKNLIAQFRTLNPLHRVLPLQAGDGPECLRLAEKWCRVKSCERLGFAHETSALSRALAAFGPLELEGVKITLGPELIAFSLFSALNSQMADIHFEKADPAVKGAGQMINWETATRLADRFKYLNREQDLGIPGLRQAKRSYDPECLLLPYHLRRKT